MVAVVEQASTAAPLTLADIKQHCRIDADDTADDNLLPQLLKAAVASAEAIIGGPLLAATCREELDAWPVGRVLRLQLAGGSQLLQAQAWQGGQLLPLDIASFHQQQDSRQLLLKPLQGWPPVDARPGAILLHYRAGLADTPETLPEDARQWLRFRVATLYDYRDEILQGSAVALPAGIVDSLIRHYRPDGVPL